MNHLMGALAAPLLLLALAFFACSNGYLSSRSLPVRFHGEKVLVSVLTGGTLTLLLYGLGRLEGVPAHPARLGLLFGFFLLSGGSAEITVHKMAKRARSD